MKKNSIKTIYHVLNFLYTKYNIMAIKFIIENIDYYR